jgi:hypothetical protein
MMRRAVVRTIVSFMGYPLKMKNDGIEVVSKIGGSWKKVKGEVTGTTWHPGNKNGDTCVPACRSEP